MRTMTPWTVDEAINRVVDVTEPIEIRAAYLRRLLMTACLEPDPMLKALMALDSMSPSCPDGMQGPMLAP